MPGTAITLYSPDEEAKISEIEAMGIKFQPKRISNGEVVILRPEPSDEAEQSTEKLDPSLIGYVMKKKKKIKPGYSTKSSKKFTGGRIKRSGLRHVKAPVTNGSAASASQTVTNKLTLCRLRQLNSAAVGPLGQRAGFSSI